MTTSVSTAEVTSAIEQILANLANTDAEELRPIAQKVAEADHMSDFLPPDVVAVVRDFCTAHWPAMKIAIEVGVGADLLARFLSKVRRMLRSGRGSMATPHATRALRAALVQDIERDEAVLRDKFQKGVAGPGYEEQKRDFAITKQLALKALK